MSLLMRIFGRAEKRAAPTSWDLLRGSALPTLSGMAVTPAHVEGMSAAYSAVQTIAETVGSLPLNVYQRDPDGYREAEPTHPVARLFGIQPNDIQTPAEFVTTMQANCLLHGAAYAEIIRDGNGKPQALWPLHPGQVAVERIPNTRRIRFQISDEVGTRRLLPAEVFAIRDRGDDPFTIRSRLDRAREALATVAATETFAASTYRNGASLSGIVSHPEQIGPEAAKTLRESLEGLYGGSKNAGRIGVLEEGMSWTAVSVSPEDAQMLESRRHSIQEVARIFRIPPPMIGDLSDATYSNIVELVRLFATSTIAPWLTRWEQAIRRDLFSEAGRRAHEVEFDMDLLVRGDLLTRLQAYRIGRETGLYSANDLRRFEHLNPREDADADTFLSPLNMQSEQTAAPRED